VALMPRSRANGAFYRVSAIRNQMVMSQTPEAPLPGTLSFAPKKHGWVQRAVRAPAVGSYGRRNSGAEATCEHVPSRVAALATGGCTSSAVEC
jgi:hypothetical protein